MIKQRGDEPHYNLPRPLGRTPEQDEPQQPERLPDRDDNRTSDSHLKETSSEGELSDNPFPRKKFDNPFEEMEFTNNLIASGYSEADIKKMSKEARLHEVFTNRLEFVRDNMKVLKRAETILLQAHERALTADQPVGRFESILQSYPPLSFPVRKGFLGIR